MLCFSNIVIAPLIKDCKNCMCHVFVCYKHCDFHFYTRRHSTCNCDSWDLVLVLKFCNLMHKYWLKIVCNFQSYIYSAFEIFEIPKGVRFQMYSVYNLNVKQFGSQKKPHILWGFCTFCWIQIVCIGHQQSLKFTASGLRVKHSPCKNISVKINWNPTTGLWEVFYELIPGCKCTTLASNF